MSFEIISKVLNEAQFMDLGVVQGLSRTLNDRELSRAIRMAISAEHEAVHLYELIADKSKSSKVKKLMQDIADEEKVHVGELENLLALSDKDDPSKRKEGNKEAKKEIGV
jgi:rubrerythrin